VSHTSHALLDRTLSGAGSLAAFLATPELARWSESITGAASTLRERALDAEHLRAQLGGADQRLFEGGRDLFEAWRRARDGGAGADTLAQDVIGSVLGLWTDLNAVQGLSAATLDRSGFDAWAKVLSASIPGVKPSYLSDLLSVDAFEVLSAGLGSLAVLLCLSRDDQQKLSEILGAMGITSIIAANPLMGLAVIAVAGYSYFKKRKIDLKSMAKGAAIAGVSAAVFAALGMPILVELVIVVVLMSLLRKHVLDNEELIALVRQRLSEVGRRVREQASRVWTGGQDEDAAPDGPRGGPRWSAPRSEPWQHPATRAPSRRARRRPGGRKTRRRSGRRRATRRSAPAARSRRRSRSRPRRGPVRRWRPQGAR